MLTQENQNSDKVSFPKLTDPSPSLVVTDKTEAAQIVARAAAETRRKRESLPAPDAGRIVPERAAIAMSRDIPLPIPKPALTEDEREARERAAKAWAAAGVPLRYKDANLLKVKQAIGSVRGDSGVTYDETVVFILELLAKPGTVALLGTRGVGKTWMACGLIREFCIGGRYAIYRDAMDYFLELKSTYDGDAKRTQEKVEAFYLRPALLVLDELHERGDTPWEDRMLTRLINKRYANNLSTILLANQTPEEFKVRIGPSIHDRMFDGGGVVVCDWPSLRGRDS